MRIAVICPIGDLNRFGYQRVAQPCLESWRGLGDLFLIHSSRAAMPFEIDATYIRDERTLLPLVDNVERFDHRVVANNANIGIQMAREAYYDVAITICVNWYVEPNAVCKIAEQCARLAGSHDDCAHLYRRMQINNQLFDADLRAIAIFNLIKDSSYTVKVLADRVEVNGLDTIMTRGHYPEHNDSAYIDTELEVTDAEWFDKTQDIRNYEDILPKRHGADFDFWVDYFQHRKANMRPSIDGLGLMGNKILALHQPDSFGDRLL